ncbi:AfsR/SARP family transcriptional regulator [Nocardia jiangsuensis]|uniref:BTAD domain-containing putative transcriptional regulator n=1 Tax=Nocardia jiangsuensis TaxID=1691563 RepID=A0ABV8DNB1_9NOCA
MDFRVLGVLEVHANGRRIDLGGVTRRAVLGYLLLHHNQVVSANRLRQALWAGDPPSTARKIVQNSISTLRKTFLEHEFDRVELLTQTPGYVLRIDPEAVDLYRFRKLVRLGRRELEDGHPALARAYLRQALGMWSGSAMADLLEAGLGWNELSAIEDERLGAYEDCFDAELSCGLHRELTPELELLTTTAPQRESFCRQYMLALYRSGRQAEALNFYQSSRAALVADLGVEPGHDLQRLHHLILTQDSSLTRRTPA